MGRHLPSIQVNVVGIKILSLLNTETVDIAKMITTKTHVAIAVLNVLLLRKTLTLVRRLPGVSERNSHLNVD